MTAAPGLGSREAVIEQLVKLRVDRRSGRMRVRSAEGERTLYLLRGDPSLVTSSVSGERIGEALVRRGLLKAEEVDKLVSEARAAGRRFDAHLAATGRLEWSVVRTVLLDLAVTVLSQLLREPGDTLFTPLDRPIDDDVRLGRPAAVVYAQALERIADDASLRQLAPERPVLTRRPESLLSQLPLGRTDAALLERCDGAQSSAELAGDRAAWRTLVWARLAGLFADSPPTAPPKPAPIPWQQWNEPRRGLRFTAAEVKERERVLLLADRAALGLPPLGFSGERLWRSAALLHPDQAHRELYRDLATKLHLLFPHLFDGRPGEPPVPVPETPEDRIAKRKVATSHLELATLLAPTQPGAALDLAARAAELEPQRTDLAARIEALATSAAIARPVLVTLRKAAASPEGAPLQPLVAKLEALS